MPGNTAGKHGAKVRDSGQWSLDEKQQYTKGWRDAMAMPVGSNRPWPNSDEGEHYRMGWNDAWRKREQREWRVRR